jgi:hypothetical protein
MFPLTTFLSTFPFASRRLSAHGGKAACASNSLQPPAPSLSAPTSGPQPVRAEQATAAATAAAPSAPLPEAVLGMVPLPSTARMPPLAALASGPQAVVVVQPMLPGGGGSGSTISIPVLMGGQQAGAGGSGSGSSTPRATATPTAVAPAPLALAAPAAPAAPSTPAALGASAVGAAAARGVELLLPLPPAAKAGGMPHGLDGAILCRFQGLEPATRACQHAALVLGRAGPPHTVLAEAFETDLLRSGRFRAAFGQSGAASYRQLLDEHSDVFVFERRSGTDACYRLAAAELSLAHANRPGQWRKAWAPAAVASAQTAAATAATAGPATAACSAIGQEARALASAVWPGADQESAAKRALAAALLQQGPGASTMTRRYGPHCMRYHNVVPIIKAHCSVGGDVLLQEDATGCFRWGLGCRVTPPCVLKKHSSRHTQAGTALPADHAVLLCASSAPICMADPCGQRGTGKGAWPGTPPQGAGPPWLLVCPKPPPAAPAPHLMHGPPCPQVRLRLPPHAG